MFDPTQVRLVPRVRVDLHRGIHNDVLVRDFSHTRVTDIDFTSEMQARLFWGPNDLGDVYLSKVGIVSKLDSSGSASTSLPDSSELLFTATAEIARVRMSDRELLALAPGRVVQLQKEYGRALDLFVAGDRVASGEAIVRDEKFSFRVITTNVSISTQFDTPGEGPAIFRVILGRKTEKGAVLASMEAGSILELDSCTGKPFVGEVDGIPIVTGDILIDNDTFVYRVREILELPTPRLEPIESLNALFSDYNNAGDGSEVLSEAGFDASPLRLVNFPTRSNEKESVSFEQISANKISSIIEKELPQTAAAVIGRLDKDKAAAVLARFDPDFALEVSSALAHSRTVPERFLRGMERILEKRMGAGILPSEPEQDNGLAMLLEILDRVDHMTANWIRIWLAEREPELSDKLPPVNTHPPLEKVLSELSEMHTMYSMKERMIVRSRLKTILEILESMPDQ